MLITRRNRWQRAKPQTGLLELDTEHPLSKGLVGAWILGLEPLTGQITDLSGSGNHGTLAGTSPNTTITRPNYHEGRSCHFNGDNNNDRIDLGSIDSANPLCLDGEDMTFVSGFKLQTTGLGNSFPRIFDKSTSGGGANGYCFYIDDGAGDDFRFDINTDTVGSTSLTTAQKTQYNITGVTYNNSAQALTYYRNVGDASSWGGQGSGYAQIPATTTNAAIGNWNHTTDRNWHGYIDFVFFWNRILSFAERSELSKYPYQMFRPRKVRNYFFMGDVQEVVPPVAGSGRPILVIITS